MNAERPAPHVQRQPDIKVAGVSLCIRNFLRQQDPIRFVRSNRRWFRWTGDQWKPIEIVEVFATLANASIATDQLAPARWSLRHTERTLREDPIFSLDNYWGLTLPPYGLPVRPREDTVHLGKGYVDAYK
jgi:hypothetical protein